MLVIDHSHLFWAVMARCVVDTVHSSLNFKSPLAVSPLPLWLVSVFAECGCVDTAELMQMFLSS